MRAHRHLSVAEYFVQVQKEYLIAEFRKKIYYSPKDKRYYTKVMGYKKEKIEDIARRNGLQSIFSSKAKMDELHRELFAWDGRPIFDMTEDDQRFYYTVGNDFAFRGEIWTLDQVNEDGTLKLYCASKAKFTDEPKENVVRIF